MIDTKFRNMNFAYDANGRVVKATKANTPDAATVYDALGNRVATKINDVWQYMIYDAFGQLVAEYGSPSDGIGGVKFVQQDHQGSVRTVTNANGYVVTRTDHQAFGETIGLGTGLRNISQGYGNDPSTRQTYGLTEADDATGQQHTWFRKIEIHAGRWTSPDPYKGSMNPRNPQSFNRYSYVNSEPTNAVDPSGLLPRCQDGQLPIDPETGQVICEVRMSGYTVTVSGGWAPDLTITAFNGVGNIPMRSRAPGGGPSVGPANPCLHFGVSLSANAAVAVGGQMAAGTAGVAVAHDVDDGVTYVAPSGGVVFGGSGQPGGVGAPSREGGGIGAFASAGPSLFFARAEEPDGLQGDSDTYMLATPIVSGQIGIDSRGQWQTLEIGGPSVGLGFIKMKTRTGAPGKLPFALKGRVPGLCD